MKKIANFIVKSRNFLLIIFLILTAISGWLMTQVTVNEDMTRYLPEDSSARVGLEIMEAEFPDANIGILHVMFRGLAEGESLEVYNRISAIENVESVLHEPNSERFNLDGNTLFIVNFGLAPFSDEARTLVETIQETFSAYDMVMSGNVAGVGVFDDMLLLMIPAFIILLIILFAMCNSWFEPFIFIVNIAAAIIINMGTNAFFESISDITHMIVAILQLVLSMDYSIIFLNRYRQEKALTDDKYTAMKNTLKNSFSTIGSIAFTTIVGMVMLVFMSFTIGRDLGLVIAKGVFISMLCVFAIMPALILMFDNLIEKTKKPTLPLRMGKITSFGYRMRFAILAVFIALFAGAFFIHGNIDIVYSDTGYDPIHQVFSPDNPVVLLYENADEENIAALLDSLAANEDVIRIDSYSTTLAQEAPSPEEMAALAQINPELFEEILELYEYGRRQFVGERFSRLIIHTELPIESPETNAFFDMITQNMGVLSGEYFILGDSAMAYEMSLDFPSELTLITILTALAFFLVAALAFRSLSVSAILVCVIQASVFITMASTHFQEGGLMFIALIIAQCLIKSRVIDYGILYTANYIEARRTLGVKEAMANALNNSIHTVMTSGLIMIVITLVVGIIFTEVNYAVSEILLLIARGCFVGVVSTVFILPSLTAVFDRFVTKRNM